jgi:amidophosphoribosyltransferase
MFNKIKEECGIFGIYSMENEEELAPLTCIGLSCLQHRGEESCGIAVNDGGLVYCEKDVGLVSDVFRPEVLSKLPSGKIAIGHVRYSTTGAPRKENAQPIVKRYAKGNICVVHNGNLTNTEELRNELEEHGAIFNSTSDTEVICSIIARERVKTGSIEEAVKNATKYLKGAYSLLVMSSRKLVAVRDPYGFRPLCMGKLGNDYVFASESCALDVVGATFERDVNPGEIITLYNNEMTTENFRTNEKDGLCIFEYVYFSRPDSNVDGMNVHKFRELAGKYLAEQAPVDADFVAGVPDSGLDAALGYSKYSKIPYDIAFVKNKYIGRTFIQSTQNKRKSQVALKLNPIPSTVNGKRIILIDDSIVRGTTITRIIKTLRRAGAKEIHLRIASPAFLGVCYFGTDVTNKEGLIATKKTVEEIRQEIGADSLEYLSLENLRKIAEGSNMKGFCEGCFTGKYPIEVPDEIQKDKFEKIF